MPPKKNQRITKPELSGFALRQAEMAGGKGVSNFQGSQSCYFILEPRILRIFLGLLIHFLTTENTEYTEGRLRLVLGLIIHF